MKKKKYLIYAAIALVLAVIGAVWVKAGAKFFRSKPEVIENNKVVDESPADEPAKINDITLPTEPENTTPPAEPEAKPIVEAVAISQYPVHQNISSTYFWVGEDASDDNGQISNAPSAWDEAWLKHFGGVDNPKKRNGYFPAGFTPKENPFYFALPYNDFGANGQHKKEVMGLVPWAKNMRRGSQQSYCKNRWIKIMKNGKAAYAQWEDVGPFGEDDSSYVFGSAQPKIKANNHVGLDVSPAVRDYLGLSGLDKVDWQFIDDNQVPDGPWKKIITTSQVYWK